MASVALSRRVRKVVGYPPLSEMGEPQRRDFHDALLERRWFPRGRRRASGCTRPATRRAEPLGRDGDLKAVQRLLGHKSMLTTADVYLDWDDNQLAQTLADALKDEACTPGSNRSL
jgi:integrase